MMQKWRMADEEAESTVVFTPTQGDQKEEHHRDSPGIPGIVTSSHTPPGNGLEVVEIQSSADGFSKEEHSSQPVGTQPQPAPEEKAGVPPLVTQRSSLAGEIDYTGSLVHFKHVTGLSRPGRQEVVWHQIITPDKKVMLAAHTTVSSLMNRGPSGAEQEERKQADAENVWLPTFIYSSGGQGGAGSFIGAILLLSALDIVLISLMVADGDIYDDSAMGHFFWVSSLCMLVFGVIAAFSRIARLLVVYRTGMMALAIYGVLQLVSVVGHLPAVHVLCELTLAYCSNKLITKLSPDWIMHQS